MQDLPEPSRVETAGGQQNRQAEIRTLDDVPARYKNYPNFEALTNDPAHHGNKIGKIIREAMTAAEADLSGKIKGPVTRSDSPYIDFYDGEGYPFDVKTPLSPKPGDKWEFDPAGNAETILDQLDKDHPNKITGKKDPVAVLLDTTYMAPQDLENLRRELRKRTKENRGILKRVFEINVQLDDKRTKDHTPAKKQITPVQAALLRQRTGR